MKNKGFDQLKYNIFKNYYNILSHLIIIYLKNQNLSLKYHNIINRIKIYL